MNVESHSRSNSSRDDSPQNSLPDDYKTTQISPSPLSNRNTVTGIHDHQILQVAPMHKAQSLFTNPQDRNFQFYPINDNDTSEINDPLSHFIIARKNIESRNNNRRETEHVWFSNDERERRHVLYSEESKESTPYLINYEQECQKLDRQLRGMEHALDMQSEEHENTEQKLKQSIIVLETEKHNMQRDLEHSGSFLRDLQSKLRIMQEEMHDLAVENSILRNNMSKPYVSTGYSMTVEEYESVSKEDVLKMLEEHSKELQEKNSKINSLSSEHRKLVSDKLQLEEDIEKLNTELWIKGEKLIKKKHEIHHTNKKLDESYEENSQLKEQIAIDDMEINRLHALCSKLSSRIEELERNATRARATLTRRNLRTLDDNLQDEIDRMNTTESSSQDSSTSIQIPIQSSSNGSAQESDSIRSICGKSLHERSWDQNIEEKQNTEPERTEPLVYFNRRPSYEITEEERGSVNAHSYPVLEHSSSAVMRSGSTLRERLRSDLSSTTQVGLYLQRKRDSAKCCQIKFSAKNQSQSELIIAGSKSFWEWRWVISSSVVILATFFYLLKVKLSNTHRQSNQIRRKKSSRIQ